MSNLATMGLNGAADIRESRYSKNILDFSTFDNAWKSANIIAKSSFCPPHLQNKPDEVLIIIQHGIEIGVKPLQALLNIAIINKRPCVWGDLMKAICETAPDCQDIIETFDDEKMIATCTVKRKGKADLTISFGIEDAKKAQLWGKQGPWVTYPKRMLQMRARGFALRDSFPHVLKGLISREEAMDYPIESDRALKKIEKSNGCVTPIRFATEDTFDKLKSLLILAKDPFKTEEAILSKFNVDSLLLLSEEQALKCIMIMENKLLGKKMEEENLNHLALQANADAEGGCNDLH